MKYVLRKYDPEVYHADIVERTTGRPVARVYFSDMGRPNPVCDMRACFLFEIARLNDAVLEYERYCSGHPAAWHPVYPPYGEGLPRLFIKQVREGELRVQQIFMGGWLAWHDGKLVYEGRTFRTCSEAQARVEAHAGGWGERVIDLAAKRRSRPKSPRGSV